MFIEQWMVIRVVQNHIQCSQFFPVLFFFFKLGNSLGQHSHQFYTSPTQVDTPSLHGL